ncbi:TPA: hypothetical protein I8Y81_003201 [Legionella pneumophila]|nr:hypothetical protein [Legionella pneumophila]HAT6979923.1 hypothetical protein [Legionella pneumophila]HBC0464543.1 hypothetical protein [Legionella pneumophila]HBC0465986.1 hypothetical protein [Legionella pneumophila]HBC0468953.1 hypothetical protein [Legionella pneumophila]
MKMFKKISLCIFAAAVSSNVCADIIELDAFNPDHCRQQILQSADVLPIIATYTSDINNSTSVSFMENFEILAKSHPERTFFKWDAKKDVQHVTQSLCLQQLGFFIQPSIILLAVVKDDNSGQAIMSSPLRLQWAGEMTTTEMDKFIDVSGLNITKSVLAHKNRH